MYSKVSEDIESNKKININQNDLYDFEDTSKEVYTVQIGAFRPGSTPKFNQFTNVFSHIYPDNYERYFSGVFETRVEADRYKLKVRKMGVKGAFTVGLKGESRF